MSTPTTPSQQPQPRVFEEQFFAFAHLPPHLQVVSKPFGDLVDTLLSTLPANSQRDLAVQLLIQAKDAAVRALVAKPLPKGAPVVPAAQQPSVGRSVHFQHGSVPCAAFITAVYEDGTVALTVMPPGEASFTTRAEQAPTEAPEPAKWNWMPRV